MEPLVYDPSPEELEAERSYRSEQDRIAEFEAWFLAQAEAESAENDSDDWEYDGPTCEDCDELHRQYEMAGRRF